jgi:hypothetical protein
MEIIKGFWTWVSNIIRNRDIRGEGAVIFNRGAGRWKRKANGN